MITLSVANVSKTFKQVNIHKAAGPEGLPGCVLRACADQLAGVFTDIFNVSLTESVIPTCFVRMPFIDNSSAFKTIVHSKLITKLRIMELNTSPATGSWTS